MAKKIAVIGGGVSGLIAIKCCRDEGLEPVCFERTNRIGGLWVYNDDVTNGQGSVMKTTIINTSKEIMAFSDFPCPAEFANYMHNRRVLEYFHMYAENFDLLQHIKYRHEILSVTKCDDFAQTGRWKLKVKDLDRDEVKEEVYDAVLVCTGHHAEKKLPEFPGRHEFPGKIVHTHDYRSHVGYEDKTVVVVGIGNSGGDVSVELSKICSQVYLSTRRGAWILNRVSDNGVPTDLLTNTRFLWAINNLLPQRVVDAMEERKRNQRFNHADYGLEPEHRFNAQHPTVNDELPNRIICGTVVVKPDVKRLTADGAVEFEDGTVVKDVDVIVAATGYRFGFPFLDECDVSVIQNKVELFKYCFPPKLRPSTLAVLGCFQPVGPIMPITELQARWATRVFKGSIQLPSREEMWDDIHKTQQRMCERYVASTRHTIQVDWVPFMDEVAEQIGCKPQIGRLLWEDLRLGLACLFGPCTPYQFRIHGPGAWPGARQAILSQWERVAAPFRTRETPTRHAGSWNWLYILILVFVIIVMFRSIG